MKLLAATAALTIARLAAADPAHAPVALRLDDSVSSCVGLDLAAVRRVVVLELGVALVDERHADATRVEVTCVADDATIRVDDPITRKLTERHVQLGALPATARPRLLALAIAETVASSWVELEMKVDPELHPPDATPPPSAARVGAAAVARARLIPRPVARTAGPVAVGASASARIFGAGGLMTIGGRLAGTWLFTPRASLGLDLDAETGGESIDAGDVQAWLFSASPRLAFHVRPGPIDVMLGAGFRLGVASMTGHARSAGLRADHFRAPWGGPVASVEARATLARRVGVALGLEAGLITMSVTAEVDEMPALEVARGWGGLSVSFTYAP